jgi:uncharacterized membrane protein
MTSQNLLKQNHFRAHVIASYVILLLAFALRVWDLNASSLWFDEAVEYWTAIVPVTEISSQVLIALQPPLFSFILHFWLLWGTEIVWMRMLSVIFSMLTIVGVMHLAKQIGGRRAGLIAGFIASILPVEVRYAQDVGEYALMLCMLVWYLNFLNQAFRRPTWKAWILWVIFTTASAYTHYGTIIVMGASGLYVWLSNLYRRTSRALIQQTVAATIALVLNLPFLFGFFSSQFGRTYQNATATPYSNFTNELQHGLEALVDTFLFQFTGWPFSNMPKLLGMSLVVVIVLLASLLSLRRYQYIERYFFGWLLVSFLLYFTLTRLGLYAYGQFGFRYALIMSSLFTVVTAITIDHYIRWQKNWLALALLGFVSVICLYNLPNRSLSDTTRPEQLWPERSDVREIAAFWARNRDDTQPTYVYYVAVPEFRYFSYHYGVERVTLPPNWLSHCFSSSCSADNIFYGAWLSSLPVADKLASIQHTLHSDPPQFWLILVHAKLGEGESANILNALLKTHHVKLSYQKLHASAYLLEQN